MPLLVLLILATAAGVSAFLAARRPLGAARGPGQAPPSLEAALDVEEEARRHPPLPHAGGGVDALEPEAATGLALTLALVLIVGGGVVLAALAVLVRSTDGLIGIDSSVADWGDRHATAASTHGLKLVTDLGETWMVLLVGVLVAGVELRRSRSPWAAPFLLAVVAGDKLLNVTIKGLVDRARPTLNPVAHTLGPSFPSGHTSTAAAFWAAAALVALRWCGPRGRPRLAGAAVGIAVGVAASRVLLDVHWLTDVVGGLALGWAWFAACTVAFGRSVARHPPRRGAGVGPTGRRAATPPSRTAASPTPPGPARTG